MVRFVMVRGFGQGMAAYQLLDRPQRAFERDSYKLTPPLHTRFVEQPLHDVLDGTLGDAHVLPNFLIGETAEDAQQYAPFPLFQSGS